MSAALVVLILGAAISFYILVGYPILLAAGRFPSAPAVKKDLRHEPAVSVIVAVHNGAVFMRGKLETLLALDYPKHLMEVIIVSDGSTDETESIVREYSDRGVALVRAERGGKAAALNQGLQKASGEILFFTDVRQPLDRAALRHLAANFADPTVGVVTGELHLLGGDHGEQADMSLYWRYEVWARKQHCRIDSTFSATGCIYAMRRSLAGPVPPDTLSDDVVLALRGFFAGFRVVVEPEAVATDYPAVAGTEFRRRLRTLAGLWQAFIRHPQLFTSRNRMRFHFLSHRFGRLVLPWTLLLVVGATLALPSSPWRSVLLCGELLVALLAVVDGFIPPRFPLKRLTSPARTFITMNAASLMAPIVFIAPASRLWVPTRVETGGPS